MRAKFQLAGLHRPVVELIPETEDERILFAVFIRFDSNAFSVYVERYENGQIERVVLSASEPS